MRCKIVLVLALLGSCASRATAPDPRYGDVAWHVGDPVPSQPSRTLAELAARADGAASETLLVEATAKDVCTKKGCWMRVEDQGASALVTWKDGCGGKYAFPEHAVGERVLIQGTLSRVSVSEEDAEHLRAESRTDFDPRKNVFEIHASAVLGMRGSR